ncbi:MAG TPA: asparagine synthase (glutamine-hydrolyzing), partial [Roseimicrobium sp.]|nr:asparagine synthase (glutamine-hydrolyzing) [Roseimicrobium sp.]
MCAICGILKTDGSPVDREELVAMRDEMVRRGPDHGGAWVEGPVGLANRRLKIIDLSENGNQPMTNEDGRLQVVFNGEIYNFQELREELVSKGHRFRSRTDTEVLVHGFEEWGEALFGRLDGMYAVAFWDAAAQSLHLVRDRYGKKPLFYLHRNGELVFASELKAIRRIRRDSLTVNPPAIDCYLHHLSPTQDHSIYKEVSKLPPAHFLRARQGKVEVVRYWKPSFMPKLKVSEDEALEAVDAALRLALRRRMVSDVPLGAFLSGGVDSSLVVALMSGLMDRPCKTFSIGFEEQDFSELRYSAQVAKHCRTDHQELVLKPDVLQMLPSMVAEYGEPFADSSAVPSYYVSKAARSEVTVALSGDGGDEFFGGYDVSRASFHAARLKGCLPDALWSGLESWMYPDGFPRAVSGPLKKLRTLLGHASANSRVRHGFTQGW